MLSSRVGRRKRHSRRRSSLAALLGVALLASNANAVDIFVTTTADSGTGSLRAAFTARQREMTTNPRGWR